MALDDADIKQVNDLINGAVTANVGKLKTEIPGMITAGLTGIQGDLVKITENLTKLAAAPPPVTPPADDKDKDKKNQPTPEVAAQLKKLQDDQTALQKRLEESDKLRADAEKKARDTSKESAIRQALGQFTFSGEEAAADAYTLVAGKVDFDDTGALIADNLPLESWIKDFIPTKKPHLLQQTGRSGAGASGGVAAASRGAALNLEDIKPGMKPEEMARVAGQIVAVLPK